MSTDDLRDYFFRLQNSPFVKSDEIIWSHLVQDAIKIAANKEYRGLQMADCIASSIFQALEPSEYGTTESRYIEELRPLFDRHPYSLRSSVKVWPDLPTDIAFSQRLEWLFRGVPRESPRDGRR